MSRQLLTRLARLFQMTTRLRRLLKPTQPSPLHQSRRKKRKKLKRSLRWLRRRATPSHPLSQSEPLLHPSRGRGVRLGRSQLQLQSRRHQNPLLRPKRTRESRRQRRNQRHLQQRNQRRRRSGPRRLLERRRDEGWLSHSTVVASFMLIFRLSSYRQSCPED